MKQYQPDSLPFETLSSYPLVWLVNDTEDHPPHVAPETNAFNRNLLVSLPDQKSFVCSRSKGALDLISYEDVTSSVGESEVHPVTLSKRVKQTSHLDLHKETIVDIQQDNKRRLWVNSSSKITLIDISQDNNESDVTDKFLKPLTNIKSSKILSNSSSNKSIMFKIGTCNPFIDSELVSCMSTTHTSPSETSDEKASFESVCLIDVNLCKCKSLLELDKINSHRKSSLLSCYPSNDHPRHILVTDKHSMGLIDSRVNACSPLVMTIVSDENRNFYPYERLQGSIQLPLRPQQHLILSNYQVGLVDERFPERILMQFTHSMDTDSVLNVNLMKCHPWSQNKNRKTNSEEEDDENLIGIEDQDREEDEMDEEGGENCLSSSPDSCIVYMTNTSSVCLLSLESMKGQEARHVVQPYSLHAPFHVFHLREFLKRIPFDSNRERDKKGRDEEQHCSLPGTFTSSPFLPPDSSFFTSCDFASSCSLTGLDIISSTHKSSCSPSFSMIGLTKRGDVMIQDFLAKSSS